MKVIEIDGITAAGTQVATFHGFQHAASVSFFVLGFGAGNGPRKHRHPYEETFILLEGEVELIADGDPRTIGGGTIAVIPPDTWHEFRVTSTSPVRMINIHPVARMVTKWAEPPPKGSPR